MGQSLTYGIHDRASEIHFERMNRERGTYTGKCPFKREELTFNYSKIPGEYWASLEPFGKIILYKGAVAGREQMGFLSNALSSLEWGHIKEAKDIIESGDSDRIDELLRCHVLDYIQYPQTPFLSATDNPERAQVFAGYSSSLFGKREGTIYLLNVQANRCILDAHDTAGCGGGHELLILGAIFPEEIRAVKINNDLNSSELRYYNEEHETCLVRRFADKNSTNKSVKDPSNWRYFY